MKEVYNNKKLLFIMMLAFVFLSYSVSITFDTAHYFSYVEILNGENTFSNWDIVRSFVFPGIIYFKQLIFGENIFGLQFLTMIFYFIFIIFLNEILNNIFINKKKYTSLIKNIVLLFCILNPIIFGYFHTLLTEFIAITISTIVIVISYKWINYDYEKMKCRSILISIFFSILLVITWHLKQPYILLVIIPIIISTIFSLIKYYSLRNLIYRVVSITGSFILLFISIIMWDGYLESKEVNMNTGRDSESILSTNLISNLNFVKLKSSDDYSSNIVNSDFFSKEEQKELGELTTDFQIVEIFQEDELVEYDYLKESSEGNISTIETFRFLKNLFMKYPDSLLEVYLNNHCAVSGICRINSNDGVAYTVSTELEIFNLFENNIIAYKTYETGNNYFPMTEELYAKISNYAIVNDPGISVIFFEIMKIPTNIIYKITMFFAPFIFLIVIIIKIFSKKLTSYVSNKLFELSIILLGTATMYLGMTAFTGLVIDRYSVVLFIPAILGTITFILYIKELFIQKKIVK